MPRRIRLAVGVSFEYDELATRGKFNLDIFWLTENRLGGPRVGMTPDVLAQEIADDLQTALEQFQTIAERLRG